MTIQAWTFLFVGLSFGLYLAIAWFSRVRDTKGFYVAGRGVPAAANGMATAADWMSAAPFLSMAGLVSFLGYAGGVYLMGWTGGYVLLALLLAPYLRKFGHFTVPDFVGDRYESDLARLVAVACAIFVSFTYVAGQMRGVGIVFSRRARAAEGARPARSGPGHHRAGDAGDGRADELDHRAGGRRRAGGGAVHRFRAVAGDLLERRPRPLLPRPRSERDRGAPPARRTRRDRVRGGHRGAVRHIPPGIREPGGRVRLRSRRGELLSGAGARHLLAARGARCRPPPAW